MSTRTIKLLVFITLLVHGIGHFQGVIGSLGVKLKGNNSYVSWLLKALGEHTNRTICLFLHLSAAILGIMTALSIMGILFPTSSWQSLALFTAVFSTLCLILFPNALAMFFNKVGAILVNLIIYYSVLLQGNWPSALFED